MRWPFFASIQTMTNTNLSTAPGLPLSSAANRPTGRRFSDGDAEYNLRQRQQQLDQEQIRIWLTLEVKKARLRNKLRSLQTLMPYLPNLGYILCICLLVWTTAHLHKQPLKRTLTLFAASCAFFARVRELETDQQTRERRLRVKTQVVNQALTRIYRNRL